MLLCKKQESWHKNGKKDQQRLQVWKKGIQATVEKCDKLMILNLKLKWFI